MEISRPSLKYTWARNRYQPRRIFWYRVAFFWRTHAGSIVIFLCAFGHMFSGKYDARRRRDFATYFSNRANRNSGARLSAPITCPIGANCIAKTRILRDLNKVIHAFRQKYAISPLSSSNVARYGAEVCRNIPSSERHFAFYGVELLGDPTKDIIFVAGDTVCNIGPNTGPIDKFGYPG